MLRNIQVLTEEKKENHTEEKYNETKIKPYTGRRMRRDENIVGTKEGERRRSRCKMYGNEVPIARGEGEERTRGETNERERVSDPYVPSGSLYMFTSCMYTGTKAMRTAPSI